MCEAACRQAWERDLDLPDSCGGRKEPVPHKLSSDIHTCTVTLIPSPPPISHQANVIEAENNRRKWTFYTLTLPETRMRANLSAKFPLLQAGWYIVKCNLVCPEKCKTLCAFSPGNPGFRNADMARTSRWCVNFLLHFQPISFSFLWIGKSGSLSVSGVCV